MSDIVDGWDSLARIVDGVWLDRMPRRPEVTPRLRTETRLLPWLAPRLPLPVPRPFVLVDDPLTVRHRLLPGEGTPDLTVDQAAEVGRFLAALHDVDTREAIARGVPDAIPTRQQLELSLARFRSDVLPLLPPQREAGPARDLLTRLATPPPVTALVHGDLGPAHVLTFGSVVSGVIDWSDAHVGDPALDLAWLVHGSGQGEVAAVAYGATAALVDRARDWHLLGPWHEVTYGLDEGRPDLVASGITGVRARLVAH